MYIYMRVSCDQYELPEVVADSWDELARLCGVNKNNIFSRRSHYKKGDQKYQRYVKVEVDAEMDETEKNYDNQIRLDTIKQIRELLLEDMIDSLSCYKNETTHRMIRWCYGCMDRVLIRFMRKLGDYSEK